MKKIFLLAAVAMSTLAATTVNAQDKGRVRIGLGPSVGMSLSKGLGIGFGVSGQGAYGITENIAGFAQFDGTFFLPKSVTSGTDVGLGAMNSFLVGGRYYLKSGFWGAAGIGYGNMGYGTITSGGNSVDGGSVGGFLYSPQIGYSTRGVDFALHYTGLATNPSFSYIGLKVIFNFVKGRSKS